MPLLFLSLFFGVLAYYYRKKKLFFSVVMFYGIGSLWGFLMTLNDYYSLSLNFGYQSISYTATLFLSVCCLILFIVLNVLNVTQTMAIAVSNAIVFESVMMILGMIKNLKQ